VSDSRDDQEEEIMKGVADMKKLMLPFAISMAQIDLFGAAVGRYFALLAFPVGAALFLWRAYLAPMHPFWNLLYIELSSGFLFFAFAPTVVALGHILRWQVPLAAVGVAVTLLLIAYNCEVFFPGVSEHTCEFVSAAFIEYAIALLLVVALEIAMRPWLDRIREEYAEARDDLARYQREAYESEANPG
jgi:hypothetical protein